MGSRKIVSFDWALKNILRDKANYVVLEGFLFALLNQKIIIKELLESESNQAHREMKFNRVDLLAEDENGEHIIVEVQYAPEKSYFKRLLYSTSKDIIDNVKLGADYGSVKKVYSVSIIYFDIEQHIEGAEPVDYVYYGRTEFTGLRSKKAVKINSKFLVGYDAAQKSDINIFPEYFILPVSIFNDEVKDYLDEWLYSLKNHEVKSEFTAPGIKEMGEKLEFVSMTEKQQRAYQKYHADLASDRGVLEFNAEKAKAEGEQIGLKKGEQLGLKKGKIEGEQIGLQKGKIETAKNMLRGGLSPEAVASFSKLPLEQVRQLKKEL